MTFFAKIRSLSSISIGTVFDHTNSILTGGGGDVVINSNIIELTETSAIEIEVVSDIITIETNESDLIEINDTVTEIQIVEEELDAIY